MPAKPLVMISKHSQSWRKQLLKPLKTRCRKLMLLWRRWMRCVLTGAVQNRFNSAITNLGNTVNNLSSARSRIEDSDYATEVSNMSRAQILQQAGTSVLAQANRPAERAVSVTLIYFVLFSPVNPGLFHSA